MRDWRKALLLAPLVLGVIAYVVFAFQGSVLRALRGDGGEPDAWALLSAARGGAVEAPRTPAQHLRAVGTVRFGDGEDAVEQDAELLLGGSARMRFRLEAQNARNVFTLDGADCWLLAGDSTEWQPYDAETLADETLLRWELARFPWGWERPLEAARQPGPGRDADGRYARRTARGTLLVDIVDGRPMRLQLRDIDAALDAPARAEVGVEAWLPPGDNLRAQPMVLTWPQARRLETWSEVTDRAMLLDATFRPPDAAAGDAMARPDLGEAGSDTGDRVSLQERTVSWLDEDAVATLAPAERPNGHWWRVDDARRLVPADPTRLAAAAAAALQSSTRRWLEWSFYARADGDAEDPTVLPQLLERAGTAADGEAWRLEVPADGRRRLHVVRVPVTAG